MPTYEYYCTENQRSVEVMHGMSTQLKTWAELCEAAGLGQGTTPGDTPVEKMLGSGMVLSNGRMDACQTPAATRSGGGCCGGMCGGHG